MMTFFILIPICVHFFPLNFFGKCLLEGFLWICCRFYSSILMIGSHTNCKTYFSQNLDFIEHKLYELSGG